MYTKPTIHAIALIYYSYFLRLLHNFISQVEHCNTIINLKLCEIRGEEMHSDTSFKKRKSFYSLSTWPAEFQIGNNFHIKTDHKPLVSLLGSKSVDELPPRIQHLRMRFMRFSCTISHIAGKNITTADVKRVEKG